MSLAPNPKLDFLSLATNPSVVKLLAKNSSKHDPEHIYFSDLVTKINRRGKEQTRAMIVTNQAIYNVLPNNTSKCKRRIAIGKIASVTVSETSDQFVVHVPEEYDYRFVSAKKEQVIAIICELYIGIAKRAGLDAKKLACHSAESGDLRDVALTKAMAKTQTTKDIERRQKELGGGDDEESDDDMDEGKDEVTSMLKENSEKVTVADFVLLKVLGRGAFGKVMLVKKKSNGVAYAMKILKKGALIKRNQVDHTKAERRILELADHPFLTSLRYAFQSKEKLYLVLDYYLGGELFFHLKKQRRFSEETARIWTAEMASALGHLHSHNFIYRDIKPENILLDSKGHLCLTDFGLSKNVDPKEKAYTLCGTLEYLAPEIVANTGHNKAVDWWSLGILLYELTVGIPPFYCRGDVNQTYDKILTGTLRFPPFLSKPCRDLITGLLNRDPTKRLGSYNDFEDIRNCAFFKGLDWDKLMAKQYVVPYQPELKDGLTDTSNFDNTFTNEPVVDSLPVQSSLAGKEAESAFDGFSYMDKAGGALNKNI